MVRSWGLPRFPKALFITAVQARARTPPHAHRQAFAQPPVPVSPAVSNELRKRDWPANDDAFQTDPGARLLSTSRSGGALLCGLSQRRAPLLGDSPCPALPQHGRGREAPLTYPDCPSLKADCSRSAPPRLSPRPSCSLHTARRTAVAPRSQHTSVWNPMPSHWPGLCPSLGHHLPRCFSSDGGMTCQTYVMSRLPSGARELPGGHKGPIRAAEQCRRYGVAGGSERGLELPPGLKTSPGV